MELFGTITAIAFWLCFFLLLGCLIISILEKRNIQKKCDSYYQEVSDLLSSQEDIENNNEKEKKDE